jgi:NTP pyrophosphatase (non-canonical NTP hydrolase)
MDFQTYQATSKTTRLSDQYEIKHNNLVYFCLGLTGEAGEVAEKVKKLLRNQGGKMTEECRLELVKELGDVLWYLTQIAIELDTDLETVAQMNLDKILTRKKANTIASTGDNR